MSYDISVIMPTAREGYGIIGQPDLHFLTPTWKSLEKQKFTSFELIIVDAMHGEREIKFNDVFRYPSFPVKHLPVDPRHRYWLDRKRWGVCGTLNTALMHAEGELVVRIDDCSEFERDFLQRFWDTYETGMWAMAMHTRYNSGKPARVNEEYEEKGYEKLYSEKIESENRMDLLKRIYGDEGLIRDTRFSVVERAGGRMMAPVDWMYGYSSFPLRAAMKVNGFDEMFDGDKSLEDVDFGSRLELAGYKNMFLLDVDHTVIEHEHKPIPEHIISRGLKPIKCNYALYKLNRAKKQSVANTGPLSKWMIEYVVKESLKPPCSPESNFYEDDCAGKLFNQWVDNPPVFDLKGERYKVLN
jgi:glycosyltransferase involved in cell wall biosynthesis